MNKNKMATVAVLSKKFIAAAVFGLAVTASAENPISSYHYLADPSAASDGDTFYILTDTDDMCVSSDPFAYNIVGLYAFSSKDMVNWTDHGMVFQSKREFGTYPGNTWASGIAVRNGRAFIVYPDASNGVGLITAPSIDGPYTDPIKEAYNVNYIAAIPTQWDPKPSVIGNCDDIDHCFDPGIFFDDDGTGYVIFGGGSDKSVNRPIGNNFDLIKFSEDNGKVTLDRNSLTRISAEKSFEAPYIHKHGDWYYISFNNSGQEIGYGMSKNPAGPYSYKGIAIGAVWQINDCETTEYHGCDGGNNHQGFADFKGKTYAVYHDRRLVRAKEHPASLGVIDPEPGNHRSVSIDEITYAADGTMNKLVFTKEGPKQVGKFDPYQTYKALTSSKQRNVRSRTDWTKGQAVKHVLTPLSGGNKESWIRVTGVDFGNGAENLRIKAANVGNGNKVEIHKGSVTGALAGSCELTKTSGWQSYTDNDCAMTGLTGVVDQLFFVFKGAADSTMGILEWEFQGTKREPEPQTAHNDTKTPWTVPGIVQAEDFDDPGYGAGNDSYYEDDADNHSCTDAGKEAECSKYRDGTGVDIYKKSEKKTVVGYIRKGEWLEYSVNAAAAGDYTMYIAAASSGGASLSVSVNGEDAGEVAIPAASSAGEEENFDDYNKISTNVTLTAGVNIIRITAAADWFDLDYFNLVKGKDAVDDNPLGDAPVVTDPTTDPSIGSSSSTDPSVDSSGDPSTGGVTSIANVHFLVNAVHAYNVFDLRGKKVGSVEFAGKAAAQALKAAGFGKGMYMLKQVDGAKTMMVNAAR